MRRWFVVAAFFLVSGPQASAQYFDTPTLRGTSPYVPASPKYTRWTGAYVGGQAGFISSQIDASNAFGSANIFSSSNLMTAPLGSVAWASPGRRDVRGSSYGGFIGYNAQFQDAVLGIELNYNRASLVSSSSASRCYSDTNPQCFNEIQLGDGNDYNATVVATTSARVTDYGTLRGRAGWAYGDFLPFATVGVAVGRVQLVAVGNRRCDAGWRRNAVCPYRNRYAVAICLGLFGGRWRRVPADVERVRARRI